MVAAEFLRQSRHQISVKKRTVPDELPGHRAVQFPQQVFFRVEMRRDVVHVSAPPVPSLGRTAIGVAQGRRLPTFGAIDDGQSLLEAGDVCCLPA